MTNRPIPESDFDERIDDIEKMGDAPDIVEWANAVRDIWPDLTRVYRAAKTVIRTWDGDDIDIDGAIRDLRLAVQLPERERE